MRCPSLSELGPGLVNRSGWPWTQESPRLPDTMSDGSSWPKVSIVTPSFNQGHFIEETIRSVLLQGYPDLEYIIIDGGSTDGSVDIIRQYAPWLTYWVSEPDRGQSHAINKGIKRSTVDILHWMNSDDLLFPSAVTQVAETFVGNPQFRLVTGQAERIDAKGRKIGNLENRFTSWSDFATRQCNVAQVATFFHRQLFDQLGFIDETLKYSMDSDLLLRFTRHYATQVIDNQLTAYRTHNRTTFEHNLVPGFREADSVYLKHVDGTGLRPTYCRWSCHHWLSVSSFDDLSYKDRVLSVREAIRMWPRVLSTWPFYLAILRIHCIALKKPLRDLKAAP